MFYYLLIYLCTAQFNNVLVVIKLIKHFECTLHLEMDQILPSASYELYRCLYTYRPPKST